MSHMDPDTKKQAKVKPGTSLKIFPPEGLFSLGKLSLLPGISTHGAVSILLSVEQPACLGFVWDGLEAHPFVTSGFLWKL